MHESCTITVCTSIIHDCCVTIAGTGAISNHADKLTTHTCFYSGYQLTTAVEQPFEGVCMGPTYCADE